LVQFNKKMYILFNVLQMNLESFKPESIMLDLKIISRKSNDDVNNFI